MRHVCFLACILVTASIALAQNQVLDKIVAVVGQKSLLLSEVETNFLEQKEKQLNLTKCKVFEELLYQKLLLNQAIQDSINISDAEVDNELTRRIAYFINAFGSEEKLEEFYGKKISMFKEELKEQVYDQLQAQRIQQKITTSSKITPSQIKNYFNSLPTDSVPLIGTEVEISHLVFAPEISEAERLKSKAEIESYRQRVLKGESMSMMAALYSDDKGSSANGGRYESMMRGKAVPEFEAIAFSLKPGEISKVFKTEFGYHFIQLIARKGETVDLRHLLLVPKKTNSEVIKDKIRLDSIRNEIISNKITFEKAVIKHSTDKETKLNKGVLFNPTNNSTKWDLKELGTMDAKLVLTLENELKVGSLSNVMEFTKPDGKPAWRIIQLNKRIDPHKANVIDDYPKIQNLAEFQLKQNSINAFIRKKSKNTYIKINDEFKQCVLEKPWIITK